MGCSNSNIKTLSSINQFENSEEEKNKSKIDVTDSNLDTERENEKINITKIKKETIGVTPSGKIELVEYIDGIEYVNKIINNEKYFNLAITEYLLLSTLFHPNIVHFKNIYKEKKESHINSVNLIIEYADDGDLNKKLNNQQKGKEFYEEKTLIFWMMQICLGLAYLHKKYILHRDIKPANIFLNKNGLIKIGDFGLSKKYNSKNDYVKKSTLVGTNIFIAPELAKKNIFSDKSDIYSLGQTFALFIDSGRGCSDEFKALIDKLNDFNYYKRPSAEEILNMDIIKEKMNLFLDENEFEKGYAFIIMKKLKEEGNIRFENDDSLIKKLKKCWNELFIKMNPNKNKDEKIRKKRDLDILMCLIDKRIHK